MMIYKDHRRLYQISVGICTSILVCKRLGLFRCKFSVTIIHQLYQTFELFYVKFKIDIVENRTQI